MSLPDFLKAEDRKRLLMRVSAFAVLSLIAIGAMASNGWSQTTNPVTGERTGWFGAKLAKNAPSSWNPIAMPSPTPTPQLSKEYVYAGSRLLAVEDKNANAAPPADLAVWRPSTGTWWVQNPATGSTWTTASWGASGDEPVPGDYDGDGTTDFSVFRPSTSVWYIIHSASNNIVSYGYGTTNDLVAPADYDGDGKTDAAVFRPSNYTWYIQGSSIGYYTVVWGASGDTPAPADYDGDGKADIAVWRTSNRKFYSINSANQSLQTIDTTFNPSGAIWTAVSGDYDGDGKADYGVYDSNAANWYIRSSISGSFPTNPVQWGASGDRSVHNDYDADGKVDYAVWTPSGTNVGRWHILNSSDSSTRNVNWGQADDIPVPAFYRR